MTARPAAPAVLAALLLLASCSGRLSGGGGGGSGGGSPGPVLPPLVVDPVEPSGLVSAVAGAGVVRLDWVAPEGVDVAVFQADSAAEVYAGTPVASAPGDGSLTLNGLADGVTQHFGVALLPAGEGGAAPVPVPVGAILAATPGAPIYVDLASPGGDGTTAEGAFSSLLIGLLTAGQAGGGNVWLAAGDYANAALPLFPGTRLYGGFAPGMQLAERDPAAHASRLHGIAGQPILRAQGGAGTAGVVLDGLVLLGEGLASAGLDLSDTPLQAAGLTVSGCAGTGIRLAAPETGDPLPAGLVACSSSGHGGEGLSAAGALDLALRACTFLSNAQEGADLDDLVAPDGRTTHLVVDIGLFAGNGSEGLDGDFAAPLFGGPGGGTFDVRVQNARFEANGAAGLLLDLDHEQAPGWRTDIRLRGVTARANGGPGVHLDLDAASSASVHRLRSTANGGDGLLVSAETAPVLVTVSASALDGNLGAGLSVPEGAAGVLLTHGVLAGNAGGGWLSAAASGAAVSSHGWLQPGAFDAVLADACGAGTDPLLPALARVPRAWFEVLAADGATLELGASPVLSPGDTVELAGDEVSRAALSFPTATAVLIDPAPEAPPLLPAVLAAFPEGDSVTEDWRALPGGAADDAGLPPPGGAAPDLGPFGLDWGGQPGLDDLSLPGRAPLQSVTPALGTPLGAQDELLLLFSGGALDPASVSAATVAVVTAGGVLLDATALAQDGGLVLAPPPGGWPAGALRLRLFDGLALLDGTPVAAPLVLPLQGT